MGTDAQRIPSWPGVSTPSKAQYIRADPPDSIEFRHGNFCLLRSYFRIGDNPLGTRDVWCFRSHQLVSSASRRWTLLGKTFNSTYGCVAIDWNESQQELALRIRFEVMVS
jgi:hypothetical protein